jgi:hypothetical protein
MDVTKLKLGDSFQTISEARDAITRYYKDASLPRYLGDRGQGCYGLVAGHVSGTKAGYPRRTPFVY